MMSHSFFCVFNGLQTNCKHNVNLKVVDFLQFNEYISIEGKKYWGKNIQKIGVQNIKNKI